MFNKTTRGLVRRISNRLARTTAFALEGLEDRKLLSGNFAHGYGFFGGYNRVENTIEFSLAPATVQTGLETLASNAGLTPPTSASTDPVVLSNKNGVEAYTIDIKGTGTDAKFTVDVNGDPITAPTNTTLTWDTLNGTGAGSNAAAAGEISAIATALNLTAPVSTTTINASTPTTGSTIYSVRLGSSTTTKWYDESTLITVDSSGNPVGNQTLPFSVIPTTIQGGLNANAPSGATTLDPTSTQTVKVRTLNGVTTYTLTFTGTTTPVTVDISGAAATLPSSSTTTFGALTLTQQDELQTLATADGVTAAISSTQSVAENNEANGTTIISVTLSDSKTGKNGKTHTYNITLSIDENGNPTVPPSQGFGGKFGEDFGSAFGGDIGGNSGNCDASGTPTGSAGFVSPSASGNFSFSALAGDFKKPAFGF